MDESRRFRRTVHDFFIIAPYKYSYLLTYWRVLIDKYLWQFYGKTRAKYVAWTKILLEILQEAQLSQRDRALLPVTEYFAVTQMTPLSSACVSPFVTTSVSRAVSEIFSVK